MLQVSGVEERITSHAAQVTKCMFSEMPIKVLLKSTVRRVQKKINIGKKYANLTSLIDLAQLSLASTRLRF